MLPASFTPQYLRQLELFKLQSRRAFLGSRQGGHVSQKRGHGIEFSDYRKYELGDNPRHIDWGVYARSDRVYVKRFREEQDLSVLVLLDTSPSMDIPVGGGKWRRAKDIALSLSYIALMQQDKVCLALPGLPDQPFSSGGRAIHRIAEYAEQAAPATTTDFITAAKRTISRVSFPGVAILVSDLLMPLEQVIAILDSMRAQNLDITVIQVLGKEDLDPPQGSLVAVDSETREQVELTLDGAARDEYAQLLQRYNETLVNYLHRHAISYAQCTENQSLGEFVLENLTKTGLLS